MRVSIFRLFIIAWQIFELDTNSVSHRLGCILNLTLPKEGITFCEKFPSLAWPMGMFIVHFLNG